MNTYKIIQFSVSRGDWDPAGGFVEVEANSLQEAVTLAKAYILNQIGENDGTPEGIEDAKASVDDATGWMEISDLPAVSDINTSQALAGYAEFSIFEELCAVVLSPENVLYHLTTPELVKTQEYADTMKCMYDDTFTEEKTLPAKLAEITSKYAI